MKTNHCYRNSYKFIVWLSILSIEIFSLKLLKENLLRSHMGKQDVSCWSCCRRKKCSLIFSWSCLAKYCHFFLSLRSVHKMLNWSVVYKCPHSELIYTNIKVNSWFRRHPLPTRVCRYFYLLFSISNSLCRYCLIPYGKHE